MSDIKIVSPSSGTATFTLTTPSGTSTDRTLTLPDQTSGTVLTTESNTPPKVPMFHAQLSSNQSLSNATTTDIIFDQVNFDSDSWYNSTTGRFTPQVAGYYLISSAITTDVAGSNFTLCTASLYFNGTSTQVGSGRIHLLRGVGDKDEFGSGTSKIVYFNGSTDYSSITAYIASGGTRAVSGGTTYANSYFCGHLLRAGSI